MNSTIADLAALGKVFEQHRVRLLAMVDRRMDPALRARMSSEDILQESFELARIRWAEFSGRQKTSPDSLSGQSVYSWLYRITLDALIEAWRKHSRGPRDVRREMPLPEASSIQLGCGLIAQEPGPATRLQQKELRELIRKAMSLLTDSDRDVLWMRSSDKLSFSEIGDVLEITENTATLRYLRAIGRLRKLWHELCPDFGSTL